MRTTGKNTTDLFGQKWIEIILLELCSFLLWDRISTQELFQNI